MNGYKINKMLTGYFSDEPISFDEWLNNHAPLNTHPSKCEVTRIASGDTFTTFCKVWTRWDEAEKRHDIAMVGLGAYGDTIAYKA